MTNLDQAREDFLRTAGSLKFNLRGQDYDFRYPDSIYMRNVVANVIQGGEYPLVQLPQYTPTTIVDIGANVGAAALYFHYAYPTAKIWSYEPSRQNFWCLEANTRPFVANIECFNYGLLDRDCELPMYHGTSQCGQNSVVQTFETAPSPAETIRLVPASREATERGWQHLSIVKIDTEGCEVPIVAELLAAVPSIDFLYCEYHDDDARHELNVLTRDRFVLGGCKADKPHQGIHIYWSRAILERYPKFDAVKKSVPRSPA